MKDENINKFFKEHKQTIENEGFDERLFSTLDCLPAPAPRVDRTNLIISVFALIGLALFIFLGGYNALIGGLSSIGTLFKFGDFKSIKPEVVISLLFMVCSLFAIGRFAYKEK